MISIRSALGVAVLCVAAGQAAAMTMYSQEQSGEVGFPSTDPVVLTFTDALPAASDGVLSLFADGGELALNNKRLEQLKVDAMTFQTPGNPAGWILPVNFLDSGGATPDPVTIPLADLNGFVADGEVEVSVVRPNFLAGGTFRLKLEYTTVPEPITLALGVVAGLAMCCRHRQSMQG